MATHNDLGKKGEALALEHLVNEGYSILEKNYRYLKAEVDIIAQKEQCLCVIEVKTRSTPDFGNPQDFVKPKQIQLLVTAVDHFITTNQLDLEVRFDIIAIIMNKQGTRLEHLKDAFYIF